MFLSNFDSCNKLNRTPAKYKDSINLHHKFISVKLEWFQDEYLEESKDKVKVL
jgi:hypothetical protein